MKGLADYLDEHPFLKFIIVGIIAASVALAIIHHWVLIPLWLIVGVTSAITGALITYIVIAVALASGYLR